MAFGVSVNLEENFGMGNLMLEFGKSAPLRAGFLLACKMQALPRRIEVNLARKKMSARRHLEFYLKVVRTLQLSVKYNTYE